MANGKIIYTPPLARALSLDEAHYLSLADLAAFNVGTGNFLLSDVFYLDSTVASPTNSKLLAGKGLWDLASAAGWWAGVVPTNTFIRVKVNDGSVTPLTIDSPNGSFNTNAWYALLCNFNRGANVDIWLGNFATRGLSLIHSAAISSRPGSWSNTNAFWMGNWGATAGRYFKGYQTLLRLDAGRVLTNAEIAEEWYRLYYGCLPEIADSTALWPFADSLVDLSDGAYALVYQGGGSPAYVNGPPYASAPLTYNFEENFSRDYEWGNLDLDDKQRAADGSSFTDAGPLKRYFRLPFKNLPFSQQAAFLAAYQSREPFQFFLDADKRRACMAKFAVPPPFTHQFLGRAEATLELEES